MPTRMLFTYDYDIFSGETKTTGTWIETVGGLEAASARMRDLAAQAPGPYFVFCRKTQRILHSVDTSLPVHIGT